MRALSTCLILLTSGASSAGAQTILDDVLYVGTQIAARETANGRTAVAQDSRSLRAEVFVRRNGGPLEPLLRVLVTRVDACKFEIAITTHYKYSLHSVDFAAADLAGAHLVAGQHNRGYLHSGIAIPGARFCHVAGRPAFSHIGQGECVDTFAAIPASQPRDDDKLLAAIHRLEKSCTAKLSVLSRPPGIPSP